MYVLQNKDTGEIVNPREKGFPLSPSELVPGAKNWDVAFSAMRDQTDLVEGFAVVDVLYAVRSDYDDSIWPTEKIADE